MSDSPSRDRLMTTYAFSIVLNRGDVTDAECDHLYESGCDDATILTRDGVTHVQFDRDAESLEDAIRSASRNVRDAGYEIARVEMDALG